MNFMRNSHGLYEDNDDMPKSNQKHLRPLTFHKFEPMDSDHGGSKDSVHWSNNFAESSRDEDDVDRRGGSVEREHMFDKVVTPSDVGKLNRLVIPKQHAEKHFPLDSSINEKGLLLNFEDRNGKPWRFRYSYWNSSQSYVMTKGWSRFVKEKKLDAGDVISFQRGVGDAAKDRLYIDWRRRPEAVHLPPTTSFPHHFSIGRSIQYPWSSLLPQPQPWNQSYYPPVTHSRGYGCDGSAFGHGVVVSPCFGSVTYLGSAAAGGSRRLEAMQMQSGGGGVVRPNLVLDSVPVVQGKAAAKRLRLFGVNMDCPVTEPDECDNSTRPTSQFPLLSPSSQSSHYNGNSLPIPSHLLDKGKSSVSFDSDI